VPNRKIFKYSLLLTLAAILIWAIHYAWISFPIISGFGAKQMCSCMFVSGRTEESIDTNDLGDFPFTLGTYKPNLKDSSVAGKYGVWQKEKHL
jgi:hypothetical protein